MPDTFTPGPVDNLIADFRVARNRLKETPIEDFDALNAELRDNTYPCMIALAEQIAEVDEIIQEVVDHQESYILPELEGQIAQTLVIATALIGEVKKVLPQLDDMSIGRISKVIAELSKSIELTGMGVSEASEQSDENEDGDEVTSEELTDEETPEGPHAEDEGAGE